MRSVTQCMSLSIEEAPLLARLIAPKACKIDCLPLSHHMLVHTCGVA